MVSFESSHLTPSYFLLHPGVVDVSSPRWACQRDGSWQLTFIFRQCMGGRSETKKSRWPPVVWALTWADWWVHRGKPLLLRSTGVFWKVSGWLRLQWKSTEMKWTGNKHEQAAFSHFDAITETGVAHFDFDSFIFSAVFASLKNSCKWDIALPTSFLEGDPKFWAEICAELYYHLKYQSPRRAGRLRRGDADWFWVRFAWHAFCFANQSPISEVMLSLFYQGLSSHLCREVSHFIWCMSRVWCVCFRSVTKNASTTTAQIFQGPGQYSDLAIDQVLQHIVTSNCLCECVCHCVWAVVD